MLRELIARFGIEFDNAQLEKGIKSLEGAIGKMRAFAGVAAAVFVGNAIKNFIGDIVQTADTLNDTATQLGTTARELQTWEFIAGQAGVESQSLAQSIGLIQRNAFAASQGSKAMRATFDRLGVSVVDANGNLKDGTTLLEEAGVALGSVESASERVAIAQALFGRSGRKLLPIFAEGAEGVAKLREEFEALGGGLSDDTIQQAAALDDEMKKLDTAFLSIKSTIALAILPTLNRTIGFFKEMAAGFSKMIKGTNVAKLAFVALGIAALALAVKMVIAFAAPIGMFLLIAVVVGLVILVVDDLITLFQGGESVIGDFIDTLFGVGTAQEVVAALTDTWNGLIFAVKTAANAVADFLGLEEPFKDVERSAATALSGRATGPEEAAREQRRQAALSGQVARGQGQTREQALEEANSFRAAAGMRSALAFNAQGGLQERQLSRRELAAQERNRRESVMRTVPGGGGNTANNTSNRVVINARNADANEVGRIVEGVMRRNGGQERNAALAALVQQGEPAD